jgi:hypothetical protein
MVSLLLIGQNFTRHLGVNRALGQDCGEQQPDLRSRDGGRFFGPVDAGEPPKNVPG